MAMLTGEIRIPLTAVLPFVNAAARLVVRPMAVLLQPSLNARLYAFDVRPLFDPMRVWHLLGVKSLTLSRRMR